MYIRPNCWEFMKCGRQSGGKNIKEFGVCPAPQDTSYNGVNQGKNAGRICWAIAGTYCKGKKQGTFAEKLSTCMACDFFKLVKKEQGIYAFTFMITKKK